MGKLKFEFSLSVSTQFDFYQHQGGTHVESYISGKKSRIACNTGVIHVIEIFTELPCSSSSSASASSSSSSSG